MMEASAAAPRWWVPGDWNGFFGLFTNVVLNVIVLTGLCLHVVNLPADVVYGRILPALGIALPLGNLYYAYLAWRLAKQDRRNDVTAMPYGPSVPHMFIVVFLIMLPIYLKTHDPLLARRSGLVWCLIIGVIVLLGAFCRSHRAEIHAERRNARYSHRHFDRLHIDATRVPGLGRPWLFMLSLDGQARGRRDRVPGDGSPRRSAVLAGLILRAIAAFTIDRKFDWAALFVGAGAVLSFFGFIHGTSLGVGNSAPEALGYLIVAGLFYALGRQNYPEPVIAAEEPAHAVGED